MFSKEQFTTVTPLSKALAMIVFIILPFAAFFLGMNFGKQGVPPEMAEIITTTTDDIDEQNSKQKDSYAKQKSYTKPPVPEGWVEYVDLQRGFAFYYPDSWSPARGGIYTQREDGAYIRTTKAGQIGFESPTGDQGVGISISANSIDEYRGSKQGSTVEEIIKNRIGGVIYLSTTKQNGLVITEWLEVELDPFRTFIVTFQAKDGSVISLVFGDIATPDLQETLIDWWHGPGFTPPQDFVDKVKSTSSLSEDELQILASLRVLIASIPSM